MVEAQNVSIRYLAGDFSDIGLKEWLIQKLKRQRRVDSILAVDDVSFHLEKGDFMGIIGVNGAGKSTLLKSVTGILPPKQGKIITEGNVVALLELGTGFDSDLNLRENILMRGALLGYSKDFIEERTDEILEFAELTQFQWYKYKQLSSGMRSRLAFSICCMVNPDILILDEVLSVGDGSFRKKSQNKMLEVIQNGAITLFVGHNIDIMRKLANKILWLDKGKQIALAENRKESMKLLDMYGRFLKIRAATPDAIPDLSKLQAPVKKTVSTNINKKEMRYQAYMKFLDELVQNPDMIDGMRAYLHKYAITHVAFYGETALAKTIFSLLQREGITVDYVVENLKKSNYCDVIYSRNLEQFPETQHIVIVDMIYTEKIREKLQRLTKIPCCSLWELFSKDNLSD